MNGSRLPLIIESIIFATDHPVRIDHLMEVINEVGSSIDEGESEIKVSQKEQIEGAIEVLIEKYQNEGYAFELRKVAGGVQFLTKRDYYQYVKQATLQNQQKRLSRAALETLSIIAYRQPVSKAELEFIRGVNCDYAVTKLLEKKLVNISGRSESPGRPLLYGTSEEFMHYFGISDINDLPKLKEFEELEEEHLDRFRQYMEEGTMEEETSSEVKENGEQNETTKSKE